MLMSAPPGVELPGYIMWLSSRDRDVRFDRTYHTSGNKWLDKTSLVPWQGKSNIISHEREGWFQQGASN